MSSHAPQPPFANRVRELRAGRGWSQAELARRAGISRAAVSGMELGQMVPSVTAALAVTRTLGCRVEDLFGPAEPPEPVAEWAWPPSKRPWRYWLAEVRGKLLAYPVEAAGKRGHELHDGVAFAEESPSAVDFALARQTLVVACCDPAAGLLATAYRQETGVRMLVLHRSTQHALDLLRRGLVHMAGLHLSTPDDEGRNAVAVAAVLDGRYKLLRVAAWEDGLAIAAGKAGRSVRSVAGSRLKWVAREPGSGARQCLDRILRGRVPTRRIAYDHWTVAEAIRCGWADAGVCLRLTCEEAGLTFLPVQTEFYDLCYAAGDEGDRRIAGLLRMLRTSAFRRRIGELPGYDASVTGDVQVVAG